MAWDFFSGETFTRIPSFTPCTKTAVALWTEGRPVLSTGKPIALFANSRDVRTTPPSKRFKYFWSIVALVLWATVSPERLEVVWSLESMFSRTSITSVLSYSLAFANSIMDSRACLRVTLNLVAIGHPFPSRGTIPPFGISLSPSDNYILSWICPSRHEKFSSTQFLHNWLNWTFWSEIELINFFILNH